MVFDFNEHAAVLLAVVCLVGVLAVLLIRGLIAGSKTRSSGEKIEAGALQSAAIPPLEDKAPRGAAKAVSLTSTSDAMAGLSYTAIAVAAAEAAARAATPVPPKPSVQAAAIDYTGEASDPPPGASYTAIAIAAAAARAKAKK